MSVAIFSGLVNLCTSHDVFEVLQISAQVTESDALACEMFISFYLRSAHGLFDEQKCCYTEPSTPLRHVDTLLELHGPPIFIPGPSAPLAQHETSPYERYTYAKDVVPWPIVQDTCSWLSPFKSVGATPPASLTNPPKRCIFQTGKALAIQTARPHQPIQERVGATKPDAASSGASTNQAATLLISLCMKHGSDEQHRDFRPGRRHQPWYANIQYYRSLVPHFYGPPCCVAYEMYLF